MHLISIDRALELLRSSQYDRARDEDLERSLSFQLQQITSRSDSWFLILSGKKKKVSLCTIMIDISSKIPSLFILISVFQRISISLYPRSWRMIFSRRSLKNNIKPSKDYEDARAFVKDTSNTFCVESSALHLRQVARHESNALARDSRSYWTENEKLEEESYLFWLDLHFDFEISRTESYDQICRFSRWNYPDRNIECNLALFDHHRSRLRHHFFYFKFTRDRRESKKNQFTDSWGRRKKM